VARLDLMRSRTAKIFLAAAAALIAGVVAAVLIEVWVRSQWDDRQGRPGFYLADAVLGTRLNPGYSGWFAGVAVSINSLGFRDNREYQLAKPPGTFRIIVLGDSVTFGHGTLYETTYPYLLEQQLKEWRPETNWQVWNLGVPGYNTGQELALLQRVGPQYQPDLVIVGFFLNDLQDNEVIDRPSVARRASSAVQRAMQRHLYSYEFYKRAALTLRWRLLVSEPDRERLEQLANSEAMLRENAENPFDQKLTAVDYFTDQDVLAYKCSSDSGVEDPAADKLRRHFDAGEPGLMTWKNRVAALQQLHAQGAYRIVFFINMAPKSCDNDDRFYDGGSLDDDSLLVGIMGDGTPAVSTTREFLHYRPSQMPGAAGHAVGNANRVKADVLFRFLRDSTLVH
jgi:GDSL-like lipase/acylhydrolase family protein